MGATLLPRRPSALRPESGPSGSHHGEGSPATSPSRDGDSVSRRVTFNSPSAERLAPASPRNGPAGRPPDGRRPKPVLTASKGAANARAVVQRFKGATPWRQKRPPGKPGGK